jgi:hypothetical protein
MIHYRDRKNKAKGSGTIQSFCFKDHHDSYERPRDHCILVPARKAVYLTERTSEDQLLFDAYEKFTA